MNMIGRIIALTLKEFIVLLKDPKSRFIVIGPPLIQFFVFGYAATYDLKNVRYAVFDESRSPESRQLLSRIAGSKNFELVKTLFSENEIDRIINHEQAVLVIHMDPLFSQDLLAGRRTTVQVIVDGRNSNVAMIALGYIGNIFQQYNQELFQRGILKVNGPQIIWVERAWFNTNLQSRWFIVSALGGLISMVVVMILTSLSVAREREFGTFDQLLVAPFTPTEILIAKSLPGMVFGLVDALLFAAGAVYWFGVPFRGTIGALILALGCFIITIVGIGLLVSSLSMTMQQALLGAFVFMMPAVILSGFATPIENMPQWLQTGTLLNPLRHVITALRAIFLQGADVSMILHQLWPLGLMACFTLPLAGWLFRRRSQ